MAKPNKRSRDDDEDDNGRGSIKSKKDAKGGGNPMLFVLLGGVVVLGLCCVCGGAGGAGWYFDWFGSAKTDKKTTIAKGDKDKNKEADKEDKGPPRGTGPLVTQANFDKAARPGMTLAQIEKILGPGLLLKGAEEAKARARPNYSNMRSAIGPGADCYQWWNNREYYYIFIEGGEYRASGGDSK
jgi:hypothetical protein